MAGIISKNFRYSNVEEFHDSFHREDTQYYFFIANKNNANATPTLPRNTHQEIDFDVWPDILAMKRLYPENIKYAIKKNTWTRNTIYDVYHSNANLDLYSNFFVFSDNKVFVCISNNGGEPSENDPALALESDTLTQPIITDDNYIWRYIYSLDNNDVLNFLTEDYLPVTPDTTVQDTTINGAIDFINIQQTGNNYPFYAGTISPFEAGEYARIDDMSGDIEILLPTMDLPRYANNLPSGGYANTNIFIDSAHSPELNSISGVSVSNTTHAIISFSPSLTIPENQLSTTFNANTQIIISPKLEIDDSGNGTGARARIANCDENGSLTDVRMVDHGKDYTNPTITITPNGQTIPAIANANLQATISPPGGHGKIPHRELLGYNVILNVKLIRDEFESLDDDATYNVFGIIKNPQILNGDLAKNQAYTSNELLEYSGDILYRENYTNIQRDVNQTEDFRIILNFYEEEDIRLTDVPSVFSEIYFALSTSASFSASDFTGEPTSKNVITIPDFDSNMYPAIAVKSDQNNGDITGIYGNIFNEIRAWRKQTDTIEINGVSYALYLFYGEEETPQEYYPSNSGRKLSII